MFFEHQPCLDAFTLLKHALLPVDGSGRDARLFMQHVVPAFGLHTHLTLSPDAAFSLNEFMRRRLSREPVARILGCWEFWSLPFYLGPDTLVPRPDSETLIEAGLKVLSHDEALILDLGTGSGCLLIALLASLPKAHGIGVDCSYSAITTAMLNAELNHVRERVGFVVADWDMALIGQFDLIVSNPPYIKTDILPTLEPEVRQHDPFIALDGGEDGLMFYRRLAQTALTLLKPLGTMIVEVGFDQAADVRLLMEQAGLVCVAVHYDLGGHVRVLEIKKSF